MLVCTDLDHTLLDARYRLGPAAAALRRLRSAGALVVLCSSKTRAEQEAWRRRLGLGGPFVVENGSAVLLPDAREAADLPAWHGYRIRRFGVEAARVRAGLRDIAAELGVELRGYASLGPERVARLAGLGTAAARRACAREFSETLVGVDAALATRLAAPLAARGLRAHPGGRFVTVTGGGADKGVAARWLAARLGGSGGAPLPLVAIGDGPNDAGMLAAADRAFVVRGPDGRYAPGLPGERLDGVGPAGFAQMVARLIGATGAG